MSEYPCHCGKRELSIKVRDQLEFFGCLNLSEQVWFYIEIPFPFLTQLLLFESFVVLDLVCNFTSRLLDGLNKNFMEFFNIETSLMYLFLPLEILL